MEYYYDGALRWSYGLDNPNKAGAVLAVFLVLIWALWQGIQYQTNRNFWLRVSRWILSALIIGAGFLLCKTYSRGSLVAATGGLVYLLASYRRAKPKEKAPVGWIGILLLIVLLCEIAFTGLASRAVEPILHSDKSVENRLVLWEHALPMTLDAPWGVGHGRSGDVYMQWYQPLGQNTGYRTLVSSYLTPLAEEGWFIFGVGVATLITFWHWTRITTESFAPKLSIALRAALLTLLIAGVFSTIWEEPIVWGTGIALAIGLATITARMGVRLRTAEFLKALLMAAALCAVLAITAWMVRINDPWQRKFGRENGTTRLLWIAPNSNVTNVTYLLLDDEVLGPTPGKLLRQMAQETNRMIVLDPTIATKMPGNEIWLSAGEGIERLPPSAHGRLILLMPPVLSSTQAKRILTTWPQINVLLPGIDEDGRTEFWEKAVTSTSRSTTQIAVINNVGVRVDWAWSRIISFAQ